MLRKTIKVDEEEFNKWKAKVKTSKYYLDFIKRKEYSKKTESKYLTNLSLYCFYHKKTLDEIVIEAQKELPLDQLDEFKEFMETLYGYNYIRVTLGNIRTFFRANDIEIPKTRKDVSNRRKQCRKQIKESPYFKDFINQRMVQESTAKAHLDNLVSYCDYCNMTLEQIMEEAKKEQKENIPMPERSIKNKLVNFKPYLVKQGYRNITIKKRFKSITVFYKHFEIDLPNIPNQKLPFEDELTYEDLPKLEHVKRALESTANPKHKLIIMINLTMGLASAEIRSITRRMYLDATKEYHDETEDIDRAIKAMDNKTDIIPIFKLKRKKTGHIFYSCCTPEANQYFINYLKTTDNTNLDEPIINMSDGGFEGVYQNINDKLNWGFTGKSRFFTSHKIRKYHATTIGDKRIADQLQGRKSDPITETYFKKNPEEIKKGYMKYIEKLSVYEKYRVEYITDENYIKMTKELKEKESRIKQLEQENKTLTTKVETATETHETLQNDVNNLSERLKEMDKQLKHLNNNEPIDMPVRNAIDLFIGLLTTHFTSKDYSELLEDMEFDIENIPFRLNNDELEGIYNSKTGTALRAYNDIEILTIGEIAYEIASNNPNFKITVDSLDNLIKKSMLKFKRNPDLALKVENYEEDRHQKVLTHHKFMVIFNKITKDLDLWNEEELLNLKSKLKEDILDKGQYVDEEITEDLVMDWIEKFM